jgi:hypothetical protein
MEKMTIEKAKNFLEIHKHVKKLAHDESFWSLERKVLNEYLRNESFIEGHESREAEVEELRKQLKIYADANEAEYIRKGTVLK